MDNEVIFVLLNDFADWESAFLAAALNGGTESGKYRVRTMSLTKDAVHSIGGFRVLPDYDINTIPMQYAALVLIGGMSWHGEEAKQLLPLIKNGIEKSIVIGAICNASLFLGAHGFLNNVKHTSNTLDLLKQWSGDKYSGEKNYMERQAVSDKNIVTANGTGYLEFTKEILLLLEADTPDNIEASYNFNKNGLCKM